MNQLRCAASAMNRTVLISGSSKGIGRALAYRLAGQGQLVSTVDKVS